MVLSPFVFLPLYLYPYNTSSWSTIISSVSDHPDLNFHGMFSDPRFSVPGSWKNIKEIDFEPVIVAPNLVNIFPDLNYEVALTSLNNYTNVLTLGYVATAWTTRDISDVMDDVESYAAWSNYNSGNIAVGGIFFDEVTSLVTNDTMSYMRNITDFAKTSLGPARQHIHFNPGVAVASEFYDIADTINIFEDTWENFNLTEVEQLSWDMLAKSTYVIHNFTGDKCTQNDLVSNITESNVTGLLITTQDSYNEISTMWPEFCDSMDHEITSGGLEDSDDDDDDDGDDEQGFDGVNVAIHI